MNITFDQTTAEPAASVSLQISTDPLSLVSLLAVDQSVLVIATGNDVTQNDVRAIVLQSLPIADAASYSGNQSLLTANSLLRKHLLEVHRYFIADDSISLSTYC